MSAIARWETDLMWSDLSPRQQEVMLGVARGLGNQEIADELGVTLPTVRNTVAAIYDKLYLSNRVEAVLWVLGHEDLAAEVLASI